MQVEDEAGALVILGVNLQVAVHLQGHLLTDRQAQSVALGEVVDLKERLEYILAPLFCDATTGIRHQELVGVRATLFELQMDRATLWCVFRCILQ